MLRPAGPACQLPLAPIRALCLLVALATAARADVITVAPQGGGDFTGLQAAVNAAHEGDTLLVKPITCGGICVDDEVAVVGKSLTILFDGGGSPLTFTWEFISIRDLQAGQVVVLRGLKTNPFFFPVPGVEISNCLGSVWIEDCVLKGARGNGNGIFNCSGASDYPGGAGLQVTSSSSVTVVRSQLLGGMGSAAYTTGGMNFGVATDGGPGASITASRVAFQECSLVAGVGGNGNSCLKTGDGGDGLRSVDSDVLLAGCVVQGAAGGSFGAPGDGVHGDAASRVDIQDSDILTAPGGDVLDLPPDSLLALPGPERSFRLPAPVREHQSATLQIRGVQGDSVAFFWSFGGGALPLPGRNGWFVLDPSFLIGPFAVGVITDPGGVLDIPFTAPDLLPSMEEQAFLLQAYFQQPGSVTLGSGTSFVLIDQAF